MQETEEEELEEAEEEGKGEEGEGGGTSPCSQSISVPFSCSLPL